MLGVQEDPVKMSALTNFALLQCLYWNLEVWFHT